MNDESSAGTSSNETSKLSAREVETHRELLRVDSQLADLYVAGHELARQSGSAHVYLLAHAGRELSRGVISALSGTVDELSRDPKPEDDSCTDRRRDRNRQRIAKALELPEDHRTVALWFDAVSVCSSHAHFRAQGREMESVRAAFLQLSELLYGRLAPFFDASAELARLSTLAEPTSEDAAAVSRLLIRPQLRRQFFASANSPLWIPMLEESGHFARVPDRLVEPDQSWRMQAWPEGDYLARMVAVAPAAAVPLLLALPRDNSNPLAWGALVEAATNAAEPYAERLTVRIVEGLRALPPVYLPHKAAELVVELARRNRSYSIRLFEALVWLRSETDRHQQLELWNRSEFVLPWSGRSTEWVLARLDLYQLQQLLERAVPLLVEIDADALLSIMMKSLERTLFLLREHDAEHGDWVSSQLWCPDLEAAYDRDDVRATFVAAVTIVAVTLASRSEAEAFAVCRRMSERDGEIWRRILWHVVSRIGVRVPAVAEAIIGSDALLDSPFGFREAGLILRECFGLVSANARARFAEAILAGPNPEHLSRLVQMELDLESETPDNADLKSRAAAAKGRWQLRRLRLFHDAVPVELKGLGRELGYEPFKPNREQQAMDEGHMLSGGVSSWGGPPSPKSPEEMAALAPAELLEFLASWAPASEREYGPNERWALNQALTTYATKDVVGALAVLRAGVDGALSLLDAAMLTDGLRDAAKAKAPMPWGECMSVLKALAERCRDRGDAEQKSESDNTTHVLRAVVGAMVVACNNDTFPPEHRDDLLETISVLVRSDFVGYDAVPNGQSWREVLTKSLDSLGGDLVRLVVNVGFWDYRQRNGGDGNGGGKWSGPDDSVAELLHPMLTALLDASVRRDDALTITIALQLESIRMLAPHWVRNEQDRLVFSAPGEVSPAMRALLQSGPRHSSIAEFRDALKHATGVAAPSVEENDSDDTVSASVLWWGVLGFLWGVWSVNESDEILDACFSASTPKERSRVYWRLFRELADSPSVDPGFRARIVALWRWRLTALLESREERAVEGEGLLWLLKAPRVDALSAVELGIETLRLGPFSGRLASGAWDRAGELMKTVPQQAFELLQQLVALQLASQYPYVPFEQVAPALRLALASNEQELRKRAITLVHQLGELGLLEFGRLLTE